MVRTAKVVLGSSLLFSWALCSLGNFCGSYPEVLANSYITQDATLLNNIAYVVEFTLKCVNPFKGEMSLYAEVQGKILPVVRTDKSYQVSWTEEEHSIGDLAINLYDDEGYAALRKALTSGDEAASVKPLAVVILNYPGVNHGFWIKSELIAAALATLVCYFAFSAISQIIT